MRPSSSRPGWRSVLGTSRPSPSTPGTWRTSSACAGRAYPGSGSASQAVRGGQKARLDEQGRAAAVDPGQAPRAQGHLRARWAHPGEEQIDGVFVTLQGELVALHLGLDAVVA